MSILLLCFYRVLRTRAVLLSICFFASHCLASEPVSVLTFIPNPDRAEVLLGKQLFHSTALSADGTISCASCHRIADGGDDGMPQSVGINAQRGTVNAPTVLNSRFNFAQFWDGRAASLEAQVEGPIHNPLEMGTNWHDVIERLSRDPAMVASFAEVYAQPISEQTITAAIVAYERELVTTGSPFDRYLAGEATAISQHAKDGYRLFKTMGCISCHQGKNLGGNMYQKFGIVGNYFKDRGAVKEADYGVYNLPGMEQDRFKFKVPSLRNVSETAPYFHDGSVQQLEEAVRIMARYQLGRPISQPQVEKLTAFLVTLTGQVESELQ